MKKKGDLTTKISFVSNKHILKRKVSRVSLDVLNEQGFSLEKENDNVLKNIKFILGKSEEEYYKFISYLSPQDLLLHENNKALKHMMLYLI